MVAADSQRKLKKNGTPREKRFTFQKIDQRLDRLHQELFLHAKQQPSRQMPFAEELAHQIEMCTHNHFQFLGSKLRRITQSTAQILHHLNKVVELLQNTLKDEEDEDDLKAAMILTMALAKDIGKEFYPHFASFISCLLARVDSNKPELSTEIFKTMNMLFNYNQKILLNDLNAIREYYAPLLGHPRQFVREFAASTFSRLVRKIKKGKPMKQFITKLLQAFASGVASENHDLRDGIAMLFFSMMQNVQQQFHSRTDEILPLLLTSYRPGKDQGNPLCCEPVFDIIDRTCEMMKYFTAIPHCDVAWKCLHKAVSSATAWLNQQMDPENSLSDDEKDQACEYLARQIHHVVSWVKHKRGSLVDDSCKKAVVDHFKLLVGDAKLFSRPDISANLRTKILHLVEVYSCLLAKAGEVNPRQLFLAKSFAVPRATDISIYNPVFEFVEHLFDRLDIHDIEQFVTSSYLSFLFSHVAPLDNEKFLQLLSRYLTFSASSSVDEEAVPFKPDFLEQLLEILQQAWKHFQEKESPAIVWKVLVCLEKVSIEKPAKVIKLLDQLIQDIEEKDNTLTMKVLSSQGYIALFNALDRAEKGAALEKLFEVTMAKLLTCPSSLATLKMVAHFLHLDFLQMPANQQKYLSIEQFQRYAPALLDNLSSKSRLVRRLTLDILNSFQAMSYIGEGAFEGECPMLSLCGEMEKIELSVSTERQFVRRLERLQVLSRSKQIPEIYMRCLVGAMIGMFNLRLSTLWSHIIKVLTTALSTEFQLLWPMLLKQLQAPLPADEESGEEEEKEDQAEDGLAREVRGENESCISGEKFTDALTFRQSIWKCCFELANHIETQSRTFIPLFLEFLHLQYYPNFPDDLHSSLDLSSYVTTSVGTASSSSTKSIRAELRHFLTTIAKFSNMKGLVHQDLLYRILYAFLIKSDHEICSLALTGILLYKQPALVHYREQLMNLSNDEAYREQLTTFHLQSEKGIILHEHRALVLPVIFRLLYGKFITRKGRSNKDSLSVRRAAILSYLNGCSGEELTYFIHLSIESFTSCLIPCDNEASAIEKAIKSNIDMTKVNVTKQLGFLNLLKDILDQIGCKLQGYLSTFSCILIAILHNVNQELEMKQKELRNLGFRRLRELIAQFSHAFAFKPYLQLLFQSHSQSLLHLPNSMIGAKDPSAFLLLCLEMGHSDDSYELLNSLPDMIIYRQVFKCIISGIEDNPVGVQVIQLIFEFIQALLNKTLEEEVQSVNQLIPELLELFHTRFSAKQQQFAQDKRSHLMKQEANILCQISLRLVDGKCSPTLALQLIQILLPFLLRNHKCSSEDKASILQVLKELIRFTPEPHQHIPTLAKFLAPGSNVVLDRKLRALVVQVFQALAEADKSESLGQMARLLDDMNAFDPKRIEEYDFDRRLDAFTSLRSTEYGDFKSSHKALLPLLSHILQTMHEEEFTLRSAARHALATFIQVIGKEQDEMHVELLKTLIIPSLRIGLKSSIQEVRREHVTLFCTYVDTLHSSSIELPHQDLYHLRNFDEPEADFFYNITHIQVHRRIRAMARLCSQLKALEISTTSCIHVLIPLIEHFVMEGDARLDQSLSLEAAKTLEAIARQLSWSHYFSLLKRFLNELSKHPQREVAIIQSVCGIIDAFHFDTPLVAEGWEAPQQDLKANPTKEKRHVEIEGETVIQQTLGNRLLPMLQKYLTKVVKAKTREATPAADPEDRKVKQDKHQIVRIPIALAMIKVLRHLPKQRFHDRLPKLLNTIIKLLRSKEEDVRTAARETLVRVALALGPTYLTPIVRELKLSLREGYMVHVLSFTVFAILEKVVPAFQPASSTSGSSFVADPNQTLDGSIADIMTILEEELFGDTGKAKDGSTPEFKSKMKEAKTSRSLDAMELLAQGLHFTVDGQSTSDLLDPILTQLQATESEKVLMKIREVFRRIALGLAKNPTVQASSMFAYVTTTFKQAKELQLADLDREELQNKAKTWLTRSSERGERADKWTTFAIQMQPKMTGYDRHSSTRKINPTTSMMEYCLYGLRLLHSVLRRRAKEAALEDTMRASVNSLVPELAAFVKASKNTMVVIHSMKCLTSVLNWPDFKAVQDAQGDITASILDHIHEAGASTNTANELIQACFRLLTLFLRQPKTESIKRVQLNDPQYRALLGFVRSFIEETDHQPATFVLLKAILRAKVVLPEIYDIMKRVGELLVQSQRANVQKACGEIYLIFVLDYPLGEKRLTQQLSFLVNNLSYQFHNGRKATIECLHAVLQKIPATLLNEKCEFFFLPIVLRLANDDDAECREAIAQMIQLFLRRLSNPSISKCIGFILQWWTKGSCANATAMEHLLERLAAQLTGFLAAIRAEALKSHLSTLVQHIQAVLARSLETSRDDEDEDDEVESLADRSAWQSIYYCLICLEKMTMALSELGPRLDCQLLQLVKKALLYPHSWVRVAAIRFLKFYLSKHYAKTLKWNSVKTPSAFLIEKGNLFEIASKSCQQLSSKNLTEEHGDEVLAVLRFSCRALAANPQLGEKTKPLASVTAAPGERDDEEEDEEQELEDSKKNPVAWIFTRLSFLARESIILRQTVIFKFFAAIVAQEEPQVWTPYLIHMINPLYRAAHDDAQVSRRNVREQAKEATLKTFALELLQLLESQCDSEVYLQAYRHVEAKLARFRTARKQARKVEAITAPAKHAQRKLNKNLAKRDKKKKRKANAAILRGKLKRTRPSKAGAS